jgi:two-component system, cell cycle response regulator
MPAKILTVDDSKTIRLIVARAFKTFDCEIMEACNGVEGLAMVGREKPDVIILDVTMPVMDGCEMLSRLRSNGETRSIPVVMLTAEAGREHVLRIAKMGVRDYLVKPFKEDQIVERVGRIVELKSRASSTAKTRKRFDDPLSLLLVDDKGAIADQIRNGLTDTPWNLQNETQAKEALETITQKLPDLVLVSLSLPEGSGFWLFQKLRGSLKTEKLPVFGLSVKTAVDEQSRAQQVGFTGIITKPIDFNDVKAKVARTLNLETSYRYFNQRDGVLVVSSPAPFNTSVANDIASHLGEKISEAVDAGLSKLIMDFGQLTAVEVALIELTLNVMKSADDLSLKTGVVCSPTMKQSFNNYEETKSWLFASTFEEAVKAFNSGAVAAA